MSELSLSDGVLYLRGEVSFVTVANLNRQLHVLMQPQVRAMHCGGVTKVDSSITAFMLIALRLAKQVGAGFSIIELPESVNRLVKLYGLEEYLQPLNS